MSNKQIRNINEFFRNESSLYSKILSQKRHKIDLNMHHASDLFLTEVVKGFDSSNTFFCNTYRKEDRTKGYKAISRANVVDEP